MEQDSWSDSEPEIDLLEEIGWFEPDIEAWEERKIRRTYTSTAVLESIVKRATKMKMLDEEPVDIEKAIYNTVDTTVKSGAWNWGCL